MLWLWAACINIMPIYIIYTCISITYTKLKKHSLMQKIILYAMKIFIMWSCPPHHRTILSYFFSSFLFSLFFYLFFLSRECSLQEVTKCMTTPYTFTPFALAQNVIKKYTKNKKIYTFALHTPHTQILAHSHAHTCSHT